MLFSHPDALHFWTPKTWLCFLSSSQRPGWESLLRGRLGEHPTPLQSAAPQSDSKKGSMELRLEIDC